MKRVMTLHCGRLLLVLLLGLPTMSPAASVEMWPSDRRRNNTQYCYGNDWNALNITVFSDKNPGAARNGKYKFTPPEPFTKDTVLEVMLPWDVESLGVSLPGTNVEKAFETSEVAESGKQYTRIRIPLDNKILTERMRNSYYMVRVWYRAPERLDDKVSWSLTYGGEVLASSSSRLCTAGVVREGRKLPTRFGFYPYGGERVVPNGDLDRMADFYRRFGVTGMEAHWNLGLPKGDELAHKMFEANRRHGIKNIANLSTFCDKYGERLASASPGTVGGDGGLVGSIDKACAGIESEAARKDWKEACSFFDMALYDWEPDGPRELPGYDDTATIAAFAKAKGIDGSLAPEQLRTEYREAYARFRMQETARPVYSLKKTLDAAKPMPLFVEQGGGAMRNIDYDVFGNDFEFVRPMIYEASPLAYARNVMEMLESTSVPAKKFTPDLTIGWGEVGPFRETPEEFLLDVIVSAAAGLGSVSHWPGVQWTDGVWFGIHEGLARIALVEDFYFDGTRSDKVSIAGIPYREKKLAVGRTTIELFGPDWRPVLLSFVHQWKGEYLLTILNYDKAQDAFVRIGAPDLRKAYLVNPVDQVYCVCDDAGQAVVHVDRQSPALWIATMDEARIAGCQRIDRNAIETQLDAAKEEYLKAHP